MLKYPICSGFSDFNRFMEKMKYLTSNCSNSSQQLKSHFEEIEAPSKLSRSFLSARSFSVWLDTISTNAITRLKIPPKNILYNKLPLLTKYSSYPPYGKHDLNTHFFTNFTLISRCLSILNYFTQNFWPRTISKTW